MRVWEIATLQMIEKQIMIFIKSGMIRCTLQQDSPAARREEGLISEADVGQSLTRRKETSV